MGSLNEAWNAYEQEAREYRMKTKCGESGPGGFSCEREQGHDGNHAGSKTPEVMTNPMTPLRLDLGCGSNKRQDGGPWTGVDSIAFPGVDVVCNLVEKTFREVSKPHPVDSQLTLRMPEEVFKPWPWADNSVTEVHSSHFIEHLDSMERVHFVNELYRILVPGGKCTLIAPHWSSCRAYGDPTHKWPPVSDFWFYYLKREWRLGNGSTVNGQIVGANAPHSDVKYLLGGFDCDFDASWGYAPHPHWQSRNGEAQQFAFQWYKDAIMDIVATLVKPAVPVEPRV